MNLNALSLFVSVIKHGSLSKTAEKLGVPIATISRQMSELEKSLQVQLFDRQKSGVKPTLEGQRLYEQVASSMEHLVQISQNFGVDSDELSGKLRISTVAGMDTIWAWIDEFCGLYPKVSIHLNITDRILDLVEDGIDFAFRIGELHTDTVVAKPMMTVKTKWLAHPDIVARLGMPRTLADLKNFPLVGYAPPEQRYLKIPHGKKWLELPFVFASNDVYAVQHAIKNGRGVGMLSEHIVKRWVEENGFIELFPDVPNHEFSIHLLYVKHRHQSLLMRAFLDFMSVKAQAD